MLDFDQSVFDVLSRSRRQAEKTAFAPSPAVAQAVMAQGQGGGDPMAQAGGAPPGMPPGGPPPGAGGPPPDAGGPPPGDPSGGGDGFSTLTAKLDQLIQLQQQAQQGAGGVGPNGKPNTASLKFEPQHFHSMVHKVNNMETVLSRIADAMGLEIPASSLLGQPNPGTPADAPGGPAAAPPGGAPAPGSAPAGPAGAGGPPPSQIAQQLPSLPPVAAKAAAVDVARALGGFAVPADPVQTPTNTAARLASLAAAFRKGGRKC